MPGKLDSAFPAQAGDQCQRIAVIDVVPEDLLVLLAESLHFSENAADITLLRLETMKTLSVGKAGRKRFGKFVKERKVLVLDFDNTPPFLGADDRG